MSPSLSVRGQGLLTQGGLLDLGKEASAIREQIQEWDAETNPNGMIHLAGALNLLMGDVMEEFCKEKMKDFDFSNKLEYGPDTGTTALKSAMAKFFNQYFHPALPVRQENVLCTNGSSSLIENISWALFDQGDAILLPTPTYALFRYNLESRAAVHVIRVPMTDVEDQFKGEFATVVVQRFEEEYLKASGQGIRVKGILICNPNNPLGRCYSKATLTAIAEFCRKYHLHLISDEVYAMSNFPTEETPENASDNSGNFDRFTSALNLPNGEENGSVSDKIHVTYGAAKDFGMGGMRLGFLVTRNQQLKKMIEKLGMYSWVTVSSDAFFTKFISDPAFTDRYFSLFQKRLRESYSFASAIMKEHKIKFSPANAGLFVWIDLSAYLRFFKGGDVLGLPMHLSESSREIKLCRYLMSNGLYLAPGEMSESLVPGYFRFTTSVDRGLVETGIKRLAHCLSLLGNEALSETGKEMVQEHPLLAGQARKGTI